MKKISEIEDEVCRLTGNTRAPGQVSRNKDEEDLRRKIIKSKPNHKTNDPNHTGANNSRNGHNRRNRR